MDTTKSQNSVYLLFLGILFFTIIFLVFLFYRVTLDRNLPRLLSSDFDSALRGSIITADGFSIANNQKLYKATVNTRNIDPNKKELFISLYSLYSGDDPKNVRKILQKNGVVTLSYQITSKSAAHLKELARKLNKKNVFIPYQDPKTGSVSTQGLNIQESGERRIYIAKDTLTPALGYVRKIDKDTFTKVQGVKGIEQVYEEYLSATQDELIIGPRDLANTVILSGDSRDKTRIDGYDVVLNIPLKLQKLLEKLADERREFLMAKEVVIAVMEANSGKIIALVSSARYTPNAITKQNYSALNSTASEYAYEIGSVFKPIIFALLLQNNKVHPHDIINTHGGKYKIGTHTVTDTHKNDFLSAENVIVQSSNIGMVELISRLDDISILSSLSDFGFAKKTGVDLSYEQVGKIPNLRNLRIKSNKATLSYGYGIQATFMQVLNAYNTINNNGIMLTPRIASHLQKDGKKYQIQSAEQTNILSTNTAKTLKKILQKVVQSPQGTAQAANIPGLHIGGKTGTAHIAAQGGYSKKLYNASFFGFASDDEGHNYTIGVLVREPLKPYPYYFSSKSALPIFKSSIEILIQNGYLNPSHNATQNTQQSTNNLLD